MKPIEPIDERLFRLDVLHEAAHLAHVDPAALTDWHLQHVAVYSESDAVAYARKRDAAVERAERTKALTAYRTTAAVAPAPAVAAWPQKGQTVEEWMTQNPTAATPLAIFQMFMDNLREFVLEMNTKNVDRNTKIAALEATVAELKNTIVELQADLCVKK